MRNDAVKLAPSILDADFARLGEQVAEAERAGADRIHVDVMDGHFVRNISMGAPIVQSLRRITRLALVTHLMISDPDFFLEEFVEAGSDSFLVHWEGNANLHRTVEPAALATRIVSGPRAGHDTGPVDANGNAPELTVVPSIARLVREEVLVRQLRSDLTIDADQLLRVRWKERTAPGLLREPPQDELRLGRSANRGRRLTAKESDGIHGRVGAGHAIQHLVEADKARRVLAIRQDNDGATPRVSHRLSVDRLVQFA